MGEDNMVAMVVGATGLVGKELVRVLLDPSSPHQWSLVYGVARRAAQEHCHGGQDKYRFVGCDLLDSEETMRKLRPLAMGVTHLFWVTWASDFPFNSQESCEHNGAMLSNALDAVLPRSPLPATLKHVSLQTGMKHYISVGNPTPPSNRCVGYDDECPRVEGATNFYYTLEDVVKERLQPRPNISWSVHRPGLVMGSSTTSFYNIMGAICVYAAVCRELGLPFLFGGDRRCWEEPYIDVADARLVARQHIWWAANASSGHEAFNAVHVDAFAWKEVWPALAASFGLELGDGEYLSEGLVYGEAMAGKGAVWEEVVEREGLQQTKMEQLANWSFLDVIFRFPIDLIGRMLVRRPTKAQRLGFATDACPATESILYWVDRMRDDRLIPRRHGRQLQLPPGQGAGL